MHSSALYKAGGEGKAAIDEIWSLAKAPVFSLTEKSKQLGLGKKGVTKYFSSNCDEVSNNFRHHMVIFKIILFTLVTF